MSIISQVFAKYDSPPVHLARTWLISFFFFRGSDRNQQIGYSVTFVRLVYEKNKTNKNQNKTKQKTFDPYITSKDRNKDKHSKERQVFEPELRMPHFYDFWKGNTSVFTENTTTGNIYRLSKPHQHMIHSYYLDTYLEINSVNYIKVCYTLISSWHIHRDQLSKLHQHMLHSYYPDIYKEINSENCINIWYTLIYRGFPTRMGYLWHDI